MDAYTSLVQRIAFRIHSRTGCSEFDLADLVQLGMVGLLEAVHRYTPSRGTRFETYAEYRINGAILNGLPSYSERQRQLAVRRELAREQAGSPPQRNVAHDDPASDCLDDSILEMALGFTAQVDFEKNKRPAAPDDAYVRVELEQLRRRVAKLTECLPESERRVIVQHYFQQLPFEDIARGLGLTNGRVSQLHHAGLRRLREHLHGLSTADLL